MNTKFSAHLTTVKIIDFDLSLIPNYLCQNYALTSTSYNFVHPDIIKADLKKGYKTSYAGIWCPGYDTDSDNILEQLSCMTVIVGGKLLKARPATILELIAYEKLFSKSIGSILLIALGEIIEGCVAFRRPHKSSGTELSLTDFKTKWSSTCRFLIVFDEL